MIFHSLCGYDVHLLIRECKKKLDSGSIVVITKNDEKNISFNVSVTIDKYGMSFSETKQFKRQLKFIESIWFMACSLAHSLGIWFGRMGWHVKGAE